MHSHCPKCQARLGEFAFKCDCGWSLDSEPDVSAIEEQKLETDLHLERAMDCIENADYPAALLSLNRAIVDAPEERLAECFSLRGYVNLKGGNFASAEKDCSQAIERNWTDAQTYAWRAAARGEQDLWRLAFDDLSEASRLAGEQRDPYLQLMQSYSITAGDYFRDVIKSGKDDADLFFDRGWVYYQSGNYEKAKRDFQQALDRDAEHGWAALGLANTLYDSQKLGRENLKAIIDLCGIAINGDNKCSLNGLKLRALANHSYGRIARAARDLKLIREQAKMDADQFVECGELCQKLGDHVNAISDFTKALELNEQCHFALQRRGDCYAEIRNRPLAINDYSTFLRRYPDDITTRIKRGQVLLKQGKTDEAMGDFERALSLDPSCFDCYIGRSQIYLSQGKLDLALNECQKAVRLDNGRAKVFAVLAEIYNDLCDYGRSIEEFSRAIQLARDPDEKAQYLYRRGAAQYELNEYAAAVDDFDEAAKLRPTHGGTWIWKAAASSRLERWSDAILGLEKAIAVRPGDASQYQQLGKPVAERAIDYFRIQEQRVGATADLHRSRGLAYQFIGEAEKAIEDFSKALSIEPEHEETLIRRGRSFGRIGDHKLADNDFSMAIKQDSKNHKAYYYRALSRLMQGNYQQSRVDVAKSIKLFPREPSYHMLHGDLLQKDALLVKALRAYDRAIRIDSSDPATHRRRGMVHSQARQYLQAVNDFSRALELNPGMAEVMVQRGQAYLKSGRPKQAIEDFELALTRNNSLAKAYSGRATVLIADNRHEYALIWLTKAIHRFRNPKDLAEIVFARGKVYYQMKRFNPAIVDFTTVLELMKTDRRTVVAARMARGIAWFQSKNFEEATKDFSAILAIDTGNVSAQAALERIKNPDAPMPQIFAAPESLIRPKRPGVVGSKIEVAANDAWDASPPYDAWVLRTKNGTISNPENKEYGPIPKTTLDLWVSEGRIDNTMKLLRADWNKWKSSGKVYPELVSKPIERFPVIDENRINQPVAGENE